MKQSIGIFFAVLIFFTPALTSADDLGGFTLPRTKTIVLQDSATKRFYEIHLQLPSGYSSDQNYPVVYMTDSPYTFPIAVGAARYPVNFKKMEKIIFVGISWEVDHSPGLSRQRDYTPTASSPGFKDPAGQADKHLAFIVNDVIAYIEKNYAADPERRTYMGNSFGGLFGAYILLNAPTTFHNYILGSPSFWWDDKYLFKLESETQKLRLDSNTRVFIAVGAREIPKPGKNKRDMVADAKKFHALLKARSIEKLSSELRVIDSASHETAFPTTAIQGLWWFFKTAK